MVNKRDLNFHRTYIVLEGDRSQTHMQIDHLFMVPEREVTRCPLGSRMGNWMDAGPIHQDKECWGRTRLVQEEHGFVSDILCEVLVRWTSGSQVVSCICGFKFQCCQVWDKHFAVCNVHMVTRVKGGDRTALMSTWAMHCTTWWEPVMSDSLQPLDCSPPGSSVHGILQARILEWSHFLL